MLYKCVMCMYRCVNIFIYVFISMYMSMYICMYDHEGDLSAMKTFNLCMNACMHV